MISNNRVSNIIIITIFLIILLSLNLSAQDHPRLYFSADDVDSLRAQGNSTHQALKDQIIGYVSNELGTTPSSSRNLSTLRLYGSKVYTFAFAWVLTGDSRYADLTRDYLMAFASWQYWDTQPDTRDLALSAMLIGNALAYDWIYDYLSESERITIRRSLVTQAEKMYQAAIATSNVDGWNNWWSNSFLQNHTLINRSALGVAGLVLSGEESRATLYIENAKQGWERISALMNGNGDGSWHESTNYGSYAFTNSLVFLVNLKRVEGTDLIPHEFFSAYGKWRIYNYIPGTVENIIGTGDFDNSWGDNSGPHILRFSARQYQDGYAQWMADEIIRVRGRYSNAWQAPEAVLEFVNYDTSVAASSPDSLAKQATFKDLEGVIWRTGWSENDLIFGFKTGANGGRFAYDTFMDNQFPWSPASPSGQSNSLNLGHDHNDINTFYIYRNGNWLAPENNDRGATSFHNSILINGEGQYSPQDANWNNYDRNDGRNDGRLEKVINLESIDFLTADASNAYSHINGLSSYKRSVIYAHSGYFLMFDSFKSSSDQQYEWVSHFEQSMGIDGSWIIGISGNEELLGVLPLSGYPEVETGDDGKPWVHLSLNGQNQSFINLLVPSTNADWSSRPQGALLADNGESAEVKVTFLTGQEDIWLFSYGAKGEYQFTEYSFDGELAMVSKDADGEITRLVLSGGTKLLSADGIASILSGFSSDQTYELSYQENTLRVSGELDTENNQVKVWAKGVTSILVNDAEVEFTLIGDLAVIDSVSAVQLPPVNIAVSPSQGSGVSQVFQATYSDVNQNITHLYLLVGDKVRGFDEARIMYEIASSRVFLATDAGSSWVHALPGQAVTLENSQVSVDVSGVVFERNQGDYSLTLPLKFKTSYAGNKNLFLVARDSTRFWSGWKVKGVFTVEPGQSQPEIISLSPENSSGSEQLFVAEYRDIDGVDNLEKIHFYMNGKINGVWSFFHVFYVPETDYLRIRDGAVWGEGSKLSAGGTIECGNASLDLSKSSVWKNNDTVKLSLFVKFKEQFVGGKNVFLKATDTDSLTSRFQLMGQFQVTTSSFAPEVVSITPTETEISVGSFSEFSSVFRDADNDFKTIDVQVRPKSRDDLIVALRYEVETGNLLMADEEGNFSLQRSINSAEILEGPYAKVDVSNSSIVRENDRLTLKVTVDFGPELLGENDLALCVEDSTGKSSGFQQKGSFLLTNDVSYKPVVLTAAFETQSKLKISTEDINGYADIYFVDYVAYAPFTEEGSLMIRYFRETEKVFYYDYTVRAWKGPFNAGDSLVIESSLGRISLSGFSLAVAGRTADFAMEVVPLFASEEVRQMARVFDRENNGTSWFSIDPVANVSTIASALQITGDMEAPGSTIEIISEKAANWKINGRKVKEQYLVSSNELSLSMEEPGIYDIEARRKNRSHKELLQRSVLKGLTDIKYIQDIKREFSSQKTGHWKFVEEGITGRASAAGRASMMTEDIYTDFYFKASLEEFYGSDSSVDIVFAYQDETNFKVLKVSVGATTTWTLLAEIDGVRHLLNRVVTEDARSVVFELLVMQDSIILKSGGQRLFKEQVDSSLDGNLGLVVNGRDNKMILKDLILADVY